VVGERRGLKFDLKVRIDMQLLFLLMAGGQNEMLGGKEYYETEDGGLHQLNPKLLYTCSPYLSGYRRSDSWYYP
jgi:hypothetical protein